MKYESAIIIGLGASGEAAARCLLSEGARVEACDRADNETTRAAAARLKKLGAAATLGRDALPPGRFDVCVLSPGVPPGAGAAREASARGIPAISELEMGWQRRSGRVLAVTGSNGKTTFANLCAAALSAAGFKAALCGNSSAPMTEAAATAGRCEWMVVEASSFQLERVEEFAPDIGVILNLHPNHLDRHGTMDAYMAAKARMFRRMREGQTAVAREEILESVRGLAACGAKWLSFGPSTNADFRWQPGRLSAAKAGGGGRGEIEISGSYFDNEILGPAAAAAFAALSACGLDPAAIGKSLMAFRGLPHRMRPERVVGGVRFTDDSKATNIAALCAGLRMSDTPVRLIAGGLPKESDFSPAIPLLRGKAKAVYLIGKAAPMMAEQWREAAACVECGDLESAVSIAWRDARPGETVLLSPGCASYDQFRNFEERGVRFVEIVDELAERLKEGEKKSLTN